MALGGSRVHIHTLSIHTSLEPLTPLSLANAPAGYDLALKFLKTPSPPSPRLFLQPLFSCPFSLACDSLYFFCLFSLLHRTLAGFSLCTVREAAFSHLDPGSHWSKHGSVCPVEGTVSRCKLIHFQSRGICARSALPSGKELLGSHGHRSMCEGLDATRWAVKSRKWSRDQTPGCILWAGHCFSFTTSVPPLLASLASPSLSSLVLPGEGTHWLLQTPKLPVIQ